MKINGKAVSAIGMGLGLYAAMLNMASAQELGGWYFGASAGQSQVDLNKEEFDELVVDSFESAGLIVVSGSSSLEDSDTAWSVFAGYRFNDYFAIEGGYQDLGTVGYRSSGTVALPGFPGTFPATLNIDFESAGFTAAGIGSIPLGETFALHGRLGVLFSDTEVTLTGGTTGFSDSDSFSASSQDIFYGVGAAFRFGGHWSISLDYQLFKDVGDEEETGEEDVDVISASLSYRL
jgi:OOP family OmpA-OmpF porin